RHQHRFHLEKIKKELGFNVIKNFCQWNSCSRKPGVYDFSEYEEVMSICDEFELNVIVNASLEDAPYWLEKQHPECRYVNSKGMPAELSGNDNHPAGGHPGLCLDNDVIIDEAKRFLREVAESAKRHPSLLGYDCWNEPHIEPNWNTDYWAHTSDILYCYCPESIRRFRQWLMERYENVEALNAAWKRYYGEWDEINPPRRHGNYADWLDWWQFWFDNLQRQMRWRYETLKAADPERFVMSHSGGIPPLLARIESGINNFTLAKEVDMWGTSMAPMAQNWTTAEAAAAVEVTQSAARGKEYWISEMQAGYCHSIGLQKCPRPLPNHIRSWNWLAAFYGAKGIMYWCYLTESTGNEAQGYGLIRFNGETTHRAREAARNFELLRQYEQLFIDHVPTADVAMLYDPSSSIIMFAQEGNDKWISHSHVAYHRQVWDSDLYTHWVTFEDLDSLTEKVLIVPIHYILTEEAAVAIRKYVSNGGTLIAENSLGLFNRNGMLQPRIPSFGLAEVCGLEEEENYYTWPDYQPSGGQPFVGSFEKEVHCSPQIKIFDPLETSFNAYGFVTPLRLTTARSLGGWKDYCLAAHNHYRKGEAYYFGTFLGLSIFNRQNGAGTLVRRILGDKVTPKVKGQELRPRLMENGEQGLLAVFNNSRSQTYTELIAVPGKYHRATDIHQRTDVTLNNSHVKVSVPPEDVVVINLL
ncbi:MAG: beta-galactosidase, partial [Pirellulales bacterium]|nr:beta-galactosidase [Pirellulales bacterium]